MSSASVISAGIRSPSNHWRAKQGIGRHSPERPGAPPGDRATGPPHARFHPAHRRVVPRTAGSSGCATSSRPRPTLSHQLRGAGAIAASGLTEAKRVHVCPLGRSVSVSRRIVSGALSPLPHRARAARSMDLRWRPAPGHELVISPVGLSRALAHVYSLAEAVYLLWAMEANHARRTDPAGTGSSADYRFEYGRRALMWADGLPIHAMSA
jgi:hypothetical protein